ncbi:hypothetical protein J7M22_19245, partial [Candidatus Poribacteria bacterium]|nr:hypothetical protein [Candidatus Poribacteria bacterium]
PLISKAGWFYTLIPSIFCPKNGGNLKERDRFGKIGLAEGGDQGERIWSNLPLIPMLMGYPPIRSLENVSKIMGALQLL